MAPAAKMESDIAMEMICDLVLLAVTISRSIEGAVTPYNSEG